jgi:hypothetical protein
MVTYSSWIGQKNQSPHKSIVHLWRNILRAM